MARLEGKVAIITGAGSGFGEAISHGFVAQGAHVIVADIAIEGGERIFNVTSRSAWERGPAFVEEKYEKLDIVVNNADTTYRKQPSVDVSETDFDKILAVNVKRNYLSVSVIMPYFLKRKYGVYLNTSSVSGSRVRPGQIFYGGTKGFLNTITQGLAAEYGPSGVRVNSLCPLRSATGLLEMFSGVADTPEEREQPNDIAQAAIYLASDEAAFITGVNLPVDGGRLAV
ncbi:putative alcohol dehydrogenase [Trichoderma barbatum]